jgi:hypothetical protein
MKTQDMIDDMYKTVVNPETHRIGMWDLSLEAGGKCRIAGVIPKSGEPANKLYAFAISWCAPSDMKKWTRVKASQIALGRLKKLLVSEKGRIENASAIQIPVSSLERNTCWASPKSWKRLDVFDAVAAQVFMPDWVVGVMAIEEFMKVDANGSWL